MVLEVPGVTGVATTIAAIFGILVIIAGVWVFNRLVQRALFDIQNQIISTRKEESAALTAEVNRLTATVARLQATIATIRIALKKQHGIEITVDGDAVTMQQTGVRKTVTVRIRPTQAAARSRQIDDSTSEGGVE